MDVRIAWRAFLAVAAVASLTLLTLVSGVPAYADMPPGCGDGPGSISGRVTLPSGETSASLRAVSVTLVGQRCREVPVDASGNYTLTGIYPGTYAVEFRVSGYYDQLSGTYINPSLVSEYYNNAANPATATKVRVGTSPVTGINAALDAGRSISGKITLPPSAPTAAMQALAALAIDSNGLTVALDVPDSSGNFTIAGLHPDIYRVKFQVGSYFVEGEGSINPNLLPEYFNDAKTLDASTPINVATANATGINATIDVGKTVSGHVTLPAGYSTDAFGAIGVYLLEVSGNEGRTARVASDGSYILEGVTPGTYTIQFVVSTYYDTATSTWIEPPFAEEYFNNASSPSAATTITVGSTSVTGVDAAIEVGRTISGTVTLPAGSPSADLNGFYVSLSGEDGTYITSARPDASGKYTLTGVGTGRYVVKFAPSGYNDPDTGEWVQPNLETIYYLNSASEQGATKVVVGASNVTGINATMRKAASISGTLSGGVSCDYVEPATVDGRPVDSQRSADPAYVDGEGNFTVSGLSAGSYRLLCTSGGAQSKMQYLSTATGETVFRIAAGQALTGIQVQGRQASSSISGSLTASGFTSLGDPSVGVYDYLADVFLYEKIAGSWVRYPYSVTSAQSNGSVDYVIPGLAPGTYAVGFETSQTPFTANGPIAEQWSGGASTLAAAAPITLGAGQYKIDVNGSVSPKSAANFTAAPTPSVSGDLVVGATLRAQVGTWKPSPTAYTIQWFRNGVPVMGATRSSYVLSPPDAGQQLSVTVAAWRNGYRTVTKASARVAVPTQQFAAAPAPTISGTAAAGSTLTAVPGSWSPNPASFTYQWYRDGSAIAGATASSLALANADAGHQISVTVTATRTGYATVTKASSRVTVAALQPFTTTPTPTITGSVAVGSKVTVNLGTWAPRPDSVTYQWFRDGVAIAGAKYYQYTFTEADGGHQVSVMVTAKKVGYRDTAKASSRVSVPAAV